MCSQQQQLLHCEFCNGGGSNLSKNEIGKVLLSLPLSLRALSPRLASQIDFCLPRFFLASLFVDAGAKTFPNEQTLGSN